MKLQFDVAPDELAVFLEETEEQLQSLDRGVLALENTGPQPAVLQEVFRAAHTLKGSSAAIGHDRMAALTHVMETVLDHLRQGQLAASTSLIDILLESLDALRRLKDELVTQIQSDVDTASLELALEAFLTNGGDRKHEIAVENIPERQSVDALEEGVPDSNFFNVSILADRSSPFPGARLLQAYLLLSELGNIARSNPSENDLENGADGPELSLLYSTEEDAGQLRDLLLGVPDIVNVHVENATAGLPAENVRLVELQAGEECVVVGRPKDVPNASTQRSVSKTVRIDVERLDALVDLIGELVIGCTRLVQLSSGMQARGDGDDAVQAIGQTSLLIQRTTDDLQYHIMKARMFPVSSVFNRFPRMVRDLARRAGKEIEFVVQGGDTELDRSLIEEIVDPLTHLLRNAVDHGIEPAEIRRSVGKPEVGVVRLQAYQRENRIVLAVEDDGRGIDPQQMRETAVEKGLLPAHVATRMSDQEAREIIFSPGFSTASCVTDISGRGVGMDIVRTNVRRLNGSVTVTSVPGQGTSFIMELPLTLAITDALLATIGEATFAIPLASVIETFRLDPGRIAGVNKANVCQLRGNVLPLLPLRLALGMPLAEDGFSRGHVVVVSTEAERAGIVVDALIGEQQVVIKSLGKYVGDVPGIAGATILGDGRVALILDIPTLVKKQVQEKMWEMCFKNQMGRLQAVASLGFENAAKGLSIMVDREIHVNSPSLRFVPVEQLRQLIGRPDEQVVAIYLSVSGDIAGHILLILSRNGAYDLLGMLLDSSEVSPVLGVMESSALGEVGNVTGAFFLNALAESTGLKMQPLPPVVISEHAGSLMDVPLLALALSNEDVLLIDTWFQDDGHHTQGLFLMITNAEALGLIIDRLSESYA